MTAAASAGGGHRIRRWLALAAYYAVAAHLPDLAFPGGRWFNRLRCSLLGQILPRCGERNEIDSSVYVGDGSDVEIGHRCQVNKGCRLTRVSIGNYVMIGPDVLVIGQLHATADTSVPMIEQGKVLREVTRIDDDVWIGARAVVMPGVHIASGAIVGAGAVVTSDVPPNGVVAGVPARLVRLRGAEATGE
jgi:maltose O-acetyltransferase